MLEFIESAVADHPKLNLKLNNGEHHRIMKSGWYGSLWIVKTNQGYRVETTGTVGTSLNPEIKFFLRRDYDLETVKGYKVWFVEDKSKVEKIIAIYGQM